MTNAIGTQAIGPTFTSELQAAGLVLPIAGFSWGSYGLDKFPDSLTASQIIVIQRVYQAHDPTKVLPAVVNPIVTKLNIAIADPTVPQSAKDVMSAWLATLA